MDSSRKPHGHEPPADPLESRMRLEQPRGSNMDTSKQYRRNKSQPQYRANETVIASATSVHRRAMLSALSYTHTTSHLIDQKTSPNELARAAHRTSQRRRDTILDPHTYQPVFRPIRAPRSHCDVFHGISRRMPLVFLSMIIFSLLAIHTSQLSSALDSPVKIQRNKLQLQQQQQQFSKNVTMITSNIASPSKSSDEAASLHNEATPSTTNKVDRVRRTNSEHQASRAAASQPECPSNRLIQSLLPPEYVGSPASSQRPSMARAHCECLADSFGWHVTCFAGSSPLGGGAGSLVASGAREISMPNQLHPAFRNSQVARQQQQQQAANSQRGRFRRSPVRSLGDNESAAGVPDKSGAAKVDSSPAGSSLAASHASADELSAHEGFGEEISPAQQASPNDKTTTPAAAPIKLKRPNHSSSRSSTSSGGLSSVDREQQAAGSSSFEYNSINLSSSSIEQPAASRHDGSGDDSSSEQLARLNNRDSAFSSTNSNGNNNDKLMLAAASNHLTFQTIPVLFGVKYVRNNMIEIDCDQAAPNYKAAMFKGFNVNEIAAFTFNNCHLPSIPFSVLLHRAAPAVRPAPSSSEPSPAAAGAAGGRMTQSLKPSRLARPAGQSLVRRRRRTSDGGADGDRDAGLSHNHSDEPAESRSNEPKVQWPTRPAGPAGGATSEPRVRSLVINLNAVVDQRTLISSLTGLDQLEDLQLNYMQLNLTNFLNDLHLAASSTQAPPPASTSPSELLNLRANLAPTPAADELIAAANAPSHLQQQQQQQQQQQPSQLASPATSSSTTQAAPGLASSRPTPPTSPTSTTSVPSPPSPTTAGAGSTPSSTTTTSTTTPQPTTLNQNSLSLRPFKKQQGGSVATTTSVISNVAPANSTNTQSQTRPIYVSSSSTKPSSNFMGAPRGLLIAQATGLPPLAATTSSQQTTVPSVASSVQPSDHSAATILSASSQANNSGPNQLTTSARQQQPAPPTTTLATTTTNQNVVLGQRQSQSTRPTTTQQNGNSLISIGTSQSHSVTYTSHANPAATVTQTSRPQSGMFHLPSSSSSPSSGVSGSSAPQTTTSSNQRPPSSSVLISSTSSSSPGTTQNNGSNQQRTLTPNRMLQSSASWTAGAQTNTPLAAGSRLSGAEQPPVVSVSSDSFSSPPSNQPQQTSPFSPSSSNSAPVNWSAMQTEPIVSTTGLSAPVNTPPFTPQPPPGAAPSNFGFRTGGQNSAFRSAQSVAPSTRRQNPGVDSSLAARPNNGDNSFVAAGGRLNQAANSQRRLHPAGATTAAQQPNTNQRFSSSFSSSALSSSSDRAEAADSNSPTSDEEFVLRGSHDFPNDDSASAPDDGDLISDSSAIAPEFGERKPTSARQKRWAPQQAPPVATTQSVAFEEFELSFGDLLPNLRSLKLESFIDLSSIVPGSQASRQRAPASLNLSRFKRQFQPADLPEKDDLNEQSEPEGSSSGGQSHSPNSLAGDESASFHHNSVMAPQTGDKSAASNQQANPNEPDDRQPDIEPGETLWRSASNTAEPDDMDEHSRATRVHPPASFQPDDSGSASSAPMDPLDSSTAALIDFSDPAQVRVRQYSALILNKLFSHLSKLRSLQLISNEIPYWPDNVLHDARHSLVRLYLLSNNLRQLGPKSLAQLDELQTLDLSSNQLRQLPAEQLRDLTNLRQLRATRNLFRKLPLRLITRQPTGVANGTSGAKQVALGRLESVDFSKNRYLSQLTLDGQQQASQLAPITSLNLTDCALNDQFVSLPAASQGGPVALFSSLVSLINISLQNNKLRDLLTIAGLFGKNKQLQRLDLSHNQLQKANNHLFNANASALLELKLNNNQISELPEQFLFNLKRLRHLSLANNKLRQLNAKTFLTNQMLESLDLSHNQLVTLNTRASGQIPFGNGASLRHLQLSHNNLSHFESDVFDIAWSFYTNLQSLDLSHNKFSGQIQMPIFYTIQDEMSLSLSSNLIQSVSVEALVQHEQVLDRYAASLDTMPSPDGGVSAEDEAHLRRSRGDQAPSRVPTVSVRLSNNPLACDCMLEPLIGYTRRVAAATNPALLATLFPSQQQALHSGRASGEHDSLPASSSRYSVLEGSGESGKQQQTLSKQPQVFYQFKFNDLHCDKPASLSRRLLSHISIGDLLCPIKDERLCPRQCDCHYQSAFKTAIVDCNGRKLSQVPEQLTDASNFHQFELETAFNLSGLAGEAEQASSNKLTISNLDKVIIRLDNNRLTSMEPLARLFDVMAHQQASDGKQSGSEPQESSSSNLRFARAPSSRAAAEHLHEAESSLFDPNYAPPSQQSSDKSGSKRKISPAEMVRKSMPMASGSADDSQSLTARQRRQTTLPAISANDYLGADVDELSVHSNGTTSQLDNATHLPVSTAVLESAEEFRNKRYLQQTCELYLDHNFISEIPELFLSALDRVRASAIQSAQVPPQAALPSAMLEPPVHTKLNHADLMAGGHGASGSGNADPMRASGSSLHVSSAPPSESVDPMDGGGPLSPLFGRQPFAAEKKAALMETINQNVRLNRLQQQQQQDNQAAELANSQQKVSVSPSLVVLSLRYNNLANLNARVLSRLGKLIRSSNTKLYLGHNPFNCSDNRVDLQLDQFNATLPPKHLDNNVLATPMGEQLLASSDATSGAYLEPAPDDLATSASGNSPVSAAENDALAQVLVPTDCPVGQLKTWLTRHHANVGDLDQIYCVFMPAELAEKLRLNNATSERPSEQNNERLHARHASIATNKWDHDHPWASSFMSAATSSGDAAGATFKLVNNSRLHKNGVTWNADLLMSSAKLIDVDLYDMCPYSNVQYDAAAIGFLSATNQRALISVAVVLGIIVICLLMMLVYFGDTQTILAFVYIHLNPVYNCLRLNESHLDGEKLYDAFVSYSNADRDIVMELIDRLEQTGHFAGEQGRQLVASGKLSNLDKSRDALVTEADLRGDLGTLQRRSTSTLNSSGQLGSFQDLSTMSRATSRAALNGALDDTTGSQVPLNYTNSPQAERTLDLNKSHASNLALNGPSSGSAENRPYRLCIHERDWLPGHLISWNIVNSVQNSRRTILILSKEFIKSVWFQVEFHTAYYQMLEDKIDRLIVIVRGELPPKHELDKNLAFLLTTKTYLTWGEKWFWERLHYALPHRSGVAPMKPLKLKEHEMKQKAAAAERQRLQQRAIQNQSAIQIGAGQQQSVKMSAFGASAANMLSSLAAGHADPPQSQLVMSNIGRDCNNLLSPNSNNNPSRMSHPNGSSSSTSSTSGSQQNGQPAGRSTSASSFLSGSSSTNQLFKPLPADQRESQMMTTSNDLLSSPIAHKSSAANLGNTTRLTIGGINETSPFAMRSSSPLATDSGRITADRLSSSQLSIGGQQGVTKSGGITSILLDGSNKTGAPPQQPASNSRLRAQKQERLKNFVDNEISNHFNLSEL